MSYQEQVLPHLCLQLCVSDILIFFELGPFYPTNVVSLINAKRIRLGKGTVGYINPTLYANPKAFNDITSGENNCAAQSEPTNCCSSGFYSASGWDPVTGLGSINYNSLESILLAINSTANKGGATTYSPAGGTATQGGGDGSSGLSGGAIAAIVILLLLLFGVSVFFAIVCRRKYNSASTATSSPTNEYNMNSTYSNASVRSGAYPNLYPTAASTVAVPTAVVTTASAVTKSLLH